MPLTFQHFCLNLSRHEHVIFMAPCSSERVDSINQPQFNNVSYCKPADDRGGRAHVEWVYWIQARLLTKQFQQVEACFLGFQQQLSTHLLAFSCPPLLFLLFALSSGLISTSAGLVSPYAGMEKLLFDHFP